MSDSVGSACKLAVKKASVWGTAVECGAGDGLPFETESITPAVTLIEDNEVSGSIQQQDGDAGDRLFSGDVVHDLKYESLEHLIAHCMGTAGNPTQQGTSDAYLHALKVNPDNSGNFLTYVFNKVVELWEFPTCKIAGFTIAHTHNERAKLTLNVIPNDLSLNTSSGTNNNTTFANVTMPTERDFLKFNQLACYINAQDGADFGASDKVYLTGYDLSFTRNYETDDVTTQFGDTIDEPIGDGFVQVSGSLTFSKYTTLNSPLLASHLAKSKKKMKLAYTGPTADTPYAYQWNMYLPNLQFSEGGAPIGGPGRVGLTMSFKGWYVLSIPTGFPTGYTDALTIEIVNLNSANPLA